jgi:hypothetical protein
LNIIIRPLYFTDMMSEVTYEIFLYENKIIYSHRFNINVYGGWFGTLRVALSIATTQPISLSPFLLVATDNATNGVLSHCRVVVLSLAKHAKWRVVVRRVIAISPFRLAYKPILRFEQIDNVTSRQHSPRQRAVWRAS